MHSKCYIFSGKEISLGIIGSSNFTQKGLVENSELNYLETDPFRVIARPQKGSVAKGHICWFEERWELSQDWSKEFLEQVIKPSKIYRGVKKKEEALTFTPYEQYIKLLQLQFGNIVDKNLGEEIESYLPSNVLKLDYQIDAVKRCISIMHEHGGFMLADVVGLGKTIIGLLIIKRFLSVPKDDGREHKVLIITPPAILSGWKKQSKYLIKILKRRWHHTLNLLQLDASKMLSNILGGKMMIAEILAILEEYCKKKLWSYRYRRKS